MLNIKITLLWIILAGLITTPAIADNRSKISFYFAAHEDDWQLFMNPSAFQDVVGGATKTVFIHTTAGDAGIGIGWKGRKHPYYLAREHGAEAAIRFMVNSASTPTKRLVKTPLINGHVIYCVKYRNTVSYFLRIPDGHWTGNGYYDTGFESLKRLANGENNILQAIDGSTFYHSWDDLVKTIRAIIDFERGTIPLMQINVAEIDTSINPNDHSDHLMTAKVALEAVKDLPKSLVRKVYYVEYASQKLPENLDSQQRDMKNAVFAVTLAGVQDFDHSTSWKHYDDLYVGRNYFRVEEAK